MAEQHKITLLCIEAPEQWTENLYVTFTGERVNDTTAIIECGPMKGYITGTMMVLLIDREAGLWESRFFNSYGNYVSVRFVEVSE